MNAGYPVQFSVDYPDRQLNRLTSPLRIFTVIPIAIVLAAINGYTAQHGGSGTTGATTVAVDGTGLLFLPPLLIRRPRAGRGTRQPVLSGSVLSRTRSACFSRRRWSGAAVGWRP